MAVRDRMFRRLAATVAGCFALTTACGATGSKVFGEESEACAATVLTNDADDQTKVEEGARCLLAEFAAGRPVIWDVLVPTVEGDPILTRYEFDGATVTITTDSTRDAFGSGGVGEQRCDGIQQTDWLPAGVGCSRSGGDGFDSDSLPGGA